MEQIDSEYDVNADTTRATFADEDGRILEVKITSEGVIIDAFEDGGTELVGTVGMMADEWWDHIYDKQVRNCE